MLFEHFHMCLFHLTRQQCFFYRALLEKGKLRGASFAAYYNGSLVVNLVGGVADLGAARLWTPETLTVTMSVSKAVAGLCVALLVHRHAFCIFYDETHWYN